MPAFCFIFLQRVLLISSSSLFVPYDESQHAQTGDSPRLTPPLPYMHFLSGDRLTSSFASPGPSDRLFIPYAYIRCVAQPSRTSDRLSSIFPVSSALSSRLRTPLLIFSAAVRLLRSPTANSVHRNAYGNIRCRLVVRRLPTPLFVDHACISLPTWSRARGIIGRFAVRYRRALLSRRILWNSLEVQVTHL